MKRCLAEPRRAHYGRGIMMNPELDESIEGGTASRKGVIIEERISKECNKFIAAPNRTQSFDSFSQKVQLEKGKLYAFSGWVQLSEGSESVSVISRGNGSELIGGGQTIAKKGCWTLLKGGIVSNFSSPVEIFFESKNTTVEIWADSVSSQPFTKEQWRSHQDLSIERAKYLKEVPREAYSHPAVQGIIIFSGLAKAGFQNIPLTDDNFRKTPAGDVVDKLPREWKSGPLEATADSRGFIDISFFHGDYNIIITNPITNSSRTLNLSVMKDVPQQTINVKIHT